MRTDMGLRVPGDMFQISTLEAHDAMVKFGSMPQILEPWSFHALMVWNVKRWNVIVKWDVLARQIPYQISSGLLVSIFLLFVLCVLFGLSIHDSERLVLYAAWHDLRVIASLCVPAIPGVARILGVVWIPGHHQHVTWSQTGGASARFWSSLLEPRKLKRGEQVNKSKPSWTSPLRFLFAEWFWCQNSFRIYKKHVRWAEARGQDWSQTRHCGLWAIGFHSFICCVSRKLFYTHWVSWTVEIFLSRTSVVCPHCCGCDPFRLHNGVDKLPNVLVNMSQHCITKAGISWGANMTRPGRAERFGVSRPTTGPGDFGLRGFYPADAKGQYDMQVKDFSKMDAVTHTASNVYIQHRKKMCQKSELVTSQSGYFWVSVNTKLWLSNIKHWVQTWHE